MGRHISDLDKAVKAYTSTKGKCVVITIEAIYPLSAEWQQNLEEALDKLREQGAAETVGVDTIAEKFEDASKILHSRARDVEGER